MDIADAARRILLRHWMIIGLCAALGLGAALTLEHSAPQYAASVRLTLDTPDPQSAAESQAIADTARGIVTSPGLVAQVIRQVHVSREAIDLAQHHIEVQPLGSSAVLQLTVTDTEPRTAAQLANALAAALLQVRLHANQGHLSDQINTLDKEIDQLGQQIATDDATITRLSQTAAGAAGATQRGVVMRDRDLLAQRQASLISQRDQLATTEASRPAPQVISAAGIPTDPEPSHRTARLMLTTLLGLMVGVGLAALREVFQPSVVGGRAVAQAMQAPVLGQLVEPHNVHVTEVGPILGRLRLAAVGAGVERVELISANGYELNDLAEHIRRLMESGPMPLARPAAGHGVTGSPASPDAALSDGLSPEPAPSSPLDVARPGSPAAIRQAAEGTAGLVLVTPDAVHRAELEPIRDLLAITHWPLIGVITYPGRRLGRRRQRREPAAARPNWQGA
jgi:capsular polysaccharide biosynthesis protein